MHVSSAIARLPSATLRRSSDPGPPPASLPPPSVAMAVVTVVEKSLLKALAFGLYQLSRDQAQYCASSIWSWYCQLQTQLPLSAGESLDAVVDSVVSLSDAQFAAFWASLLEAERRKQAPAAVLLEAAAAKSCCCRHNAEDTARPQQRHTLVQQILYRVQRLFRPRNAKRFASQTPCTSPYDPMDDSHFVPRTSSRRDLLDLSSDGGSVNGSNDTPPVLENDPLEPGWAVEYMEQESVVPTAMTQRMRKMMHSTIPLNLFRVTVTYNGSDCDDAPGYGGLVTPESIAPTPITRDLQTRGIHRYTVFVLDHATLALRLLETQYAR